MTHLNLLIKKRGTMPENDGPDKPFEVIKGGKPDVRLPKVHPNKKKDVLTAKQEKFAGLVARGEPLGEAYAAAYSAEGMKKSTIFVEASKLADNPKVSERIKELQAKQEKALHNDAVRIRRHVIERLYKESTKDDSPAAARITALTQLGKLDIVGAFRERIETNQDEKTPAELQEELEKELEQLVSNNAE